MPAKKLVIFGLLAFLDKRSKTKGAIGGLDMNLPKAGPVTKRLNYVWLGLLGLAVLSIIVAIVVRNLNIAWIGAGALVIMMGIAFVRNITWLSGK